MRSNHHHHRFKLPKDRVIHFAEPTGRCFICGKPALHRVTEVDVPGPPVVSVDFCGFHFTRIFKMPANRFPKQIKKVLAQVTKEADFPVRAFCLRRHMNVPLKFVGQRLVSHYITLPTYDLFFALYANLKGEKCVSIARVLSKSVAINIVQTMVDENFISAAKVALREQEMVMDFPEDDKYEVLGACTKFFELCGEELPEK